MAATALAVGGLAVASISGAPAGAAAACAGGTIVVSTTADTGSGSLRQAFADANTADGGTICIDTTVVTSPITITSGVLQYAGTGALMVLGNGAVVQGNNSSALIYSGSGNTMEIHELTVTGGSAGSGSGVRAGNGSVVMVDSTVTGNTASSFGAGVSGVNVTLIRTTVSNNTVTDGDGAGINAGTATLINSTVTGNRATEGGGGVEAGTALSLAYSTVVGNTSPEFANVWLNNDVPLSSFGSVVTNPLGGGVNCNVDSTSSDGYNYSDDSTCGFTATGDVQNGASPQLGGLAANGGPTETMLPGAASPLIDAIPDAACQDAGAAGITTDQRGVTRPQVGGCDIGAVEVEAVVPLTPIIPITPAAPVAVQPLFTG
jgi:hypothetical protein